MKKFNNINWIFFDFGGTLDSPGIHSRKLFYNTFNEFIAPLDNTIFQDAYSYTDELIVSASLITQANLSQMNETICSLIAKQLQISNDIAIKVSKKITSIQTMELNKNKSFLQTLSKNYKLGIVSNFSGNLEIILREFDLNHHFSFVIDSYYLGFKKPEVEIYQHALKLANTSANQVVFVGDNLERDITWPKKLGFSTLWINPSLKKDVHADETVRDLESARCFFIQ